ncbi:hypothetical protein ACIOUE_38015 [Streptomyces xanthochromogenes]|uniref:hypothetical protein n=1 Tax=Streptomyces xanthochromogenes TaxID=67384 RepID=UPI0038182A82
MADKTPQHGWASTPSRQEQNIEGQPAGDFTQSPPEWSAEESYGVLYQPVTYEGATYWVQAPNKGQPPAQNSGEGKPWRSTDPFA